MDAPKIGRYQVLSLLGRGGMAEVFKCKLEGLGGFDKIVVVKRILPELAHEEEFLRMFLDEARLVARLQHPNSVQVLEVDQVDGLPFITMDFVGRPPLLEIHELLGEEVPLPREHAITIISDICLGLDHTHNFKDTDGEPLKIIHRDVSPPNIIVSPEGESRLLDFGVAKAEVRLAQTRAGMVKGKLAYLAPEQIKQTDVDQRVDVFSTGICLYRATTGRFPFRGRSDVEQMASILKGDYRPPSEIDPSYPPELERIVRWALMHEPAERCPSSRALHDALKEYVRNSGIEANPGKVSEWVRQLYPDPSVFDGDPVDAARLAAGPRHQFKFAHDSGLSPEMQAALSGGSRSGVSPFAQPSDSQAAYQMTDMVRQGPPSKLPWILIGIAMVLLVVVVGVGLGLLLRQQRRGPAVAAPVDDKADENLRSYLDEVETLSKERQFRLAFDVLERAKKVTSHDSELNIRLALLSAQVDKEYNLARAKKALVIGDTKVAAEHARKVLEREADNAEALAVMEKARAGAK